MILLSKTRRPACHQYWCYFILGQLIPGEFQGVPVKVLTRDSARGRRPQAWEAGGQREGNENGLSSHRQRWNHTLEEDAGEFGNNRTYRCEKEHKREA